MLNISSFLYPDGTVIVVLGTTLCGKTCSSSVQGERRVVFRWVLGVACFSSFFAVKFDAAQALLHGFTNGIVGVHWPRLAL